MLGKLGALLKALPDGILLYDNQVSVDRWDRFSRHPNKNAFFNW